MLEELCRSALWDICRDCVDYSPLVMLKDGRVVRQSDISKLFAPFFNSGDHVFDWNFLPIKTVSRKRKSSIERLSWIWFNENSEAICNGFLQDMYRGNVERAMISTGSFRVLFSEFKNYFDKRRNEFVEKQTQALQTRKSELAKNGKVPQSYGGVANLLKVLSKTSLEQGSSIQTIAKVQFAVCMQAGIVLPDEFLTDVLTASSIMGVNDGN